MLRAFVIATGIAQDVAEIVERAHRVGFQFQRGARGCFCVCETTLTAQNCGSVGMQFRLMRRALDGRQQVLIRVRQSLVLIGQQTEHMMCVAIVRVAIEDSLRDFGGSGCVAGLIKSMQPVAVAQSPFIPQRSVRLLDALGEACRVPQWRAFHARTQLLAQSREGRKVGRRCDRTRHVLLWAASYPIVQSDSVQNTGTKPTETGLTRERYDRHTLPQCLNGRGASIMRKRIQRDVDVAIGCPGARLWLGVDKIKPFRGNTKLCEARQEQRAEGRLVERQVVEDKSRIRHGCQDPHPGDDDVIIEPLGASEITEGDMVPRQRERRLDGWHVCGRRVDQRNPRQADDPLTEEGFCSWRREGIVGQEGIHLRKTGGIAVTQQIRDLNRSRSAGKCQQPVAGGMSRQVD